MKRQFEGFETFPGIEEGYIEEKIPVSVMDGLAMTEPGGMDVDNLLGVRRVVQCITYAILTILVISCNIFTLALLKRTQELFDKTTIFLYKVLAVENMLAGLCGAIYGVIMGPTSVWPHDQISCSILLRGHFLFLYQSALVLCCISLDRCLMVTLPLRYPTIVTPKRAKFGLGVILALSFCPFVPILPIDGFPLSQSTEDRCEGNAFKIEGSDLAWVGMLFVFIAIPLFTTTIANTCMMRAALKQRKRVKPKCNHNLAVIADAASTSPSRFRTDTSSSTNDAKRDAPKHDTRTRRSKPRRNSLELKTLRTVVVMTIAYYVSWIPITVFFVLQSSAMALE
ncbi:trace amine-associated receptor 8c-like [Diadema setosum]|uniref:trace amine-associated receptor 8c-like n=1 Tax=Diadema setosum TaxID=31175 RepID=UPI003B3B95E5